ncbi:hypothetical protein YC2023_115092 [Brassica napus]
MKCGLEMFMWCGGEENVNDLVRQPFYRFLQRTLYLHLIAFGFLLYIWGGMPFLVWGMNWQYQGVSNVARSHSTFLVNSVCHTWGTRAWNTPDLSRNNWFREDSPEISSGEKGEIAGEEGEEPNRKKREMGKKKRFVVIKLRVRRIVSVGISSEKGHVAKSLRKYSLGDY